MGALESLFYLLWGLQRKINWAVPFSSNGASSASGTEFFSEILTLRPYNWSNFRARNIFDHTIRFAIRFSTKSSGVFFWLSLTVFLRIKEICWKVRKCGFCLYLTLVAYYAPPLGISKFLFLYLIQPICSWFKQKN